MLNAQKCSQGEQCIGWLLAAGQPRCVLKAASPSKGRLFERDTDKTTLEIARIHLGCEPPGPRDARVVVWECLARAAQQCLPTVAMSPVHPSHPHHGSVPSASLPLTPWLRIQVTQPRVLPPTLLARQVQGLPPRKYIPWNHSHKIQLIPTAPFVTKNHGLAWKQRRSFLQLKIKVLPVATSNPAGTGSGVH